MGGVLNGLIAALTKRYYLIVANNTGSTGSSVRSYQINKGLSGTVTSDPFFIRNSFFAVALSANKKSIAATGISTAGNTNLRATSFDNNTGTFTGTNYSVAFGTTNNTSTGRVAFAPNGFSVAAFSAGSTATPWVWGYPWNDSTGFGTKYLNPGTLPSSTTSAATSPIGITFSPDSETIAMGGSTTPFIHAYRWAAGGGSVAFGTKYANPAPSPGGVGYAVKFNPAGNVLYTGLYAYAWSSGFSTRYTNPATVAFDVTDAVWNSTGDVILLSSLFSPYIFAYPWSSGWGTKYANPATLPTGAANTITLAEAETSVYIGLTSSPYIEGYNWSTSGGFGTKFANPATALTAKVTSITSNG